MSETHEKSRNFLEARIEEDLEAGTDGGRVLTRFPPEPNGYLHIGHAKAICIDFGLAEKYGGACNLRFDDTNPAKEEDEYVDAIQDDVRWLGFDWGERLFFASDRFEDLYRLAEALVEKGAAYVCDLDAEATRAGRGAAGEPGTDSPFRDRSVEENLDLLRRMRAGEFPEGARTLRAKIDMAHTNLTMRDPVLYRIVKATHHRTGDAWSIYPTYDWAHGQCDALEGVTHSLCTLEFENHRPLYDWCLDQLAPVAGDLFASRPRQIEFSRLELTYTITSKRKLLRLIEEGHVSGWDDPRMPTLRGMRRLGYTPGAIRSLIDTVGVTKTHSRIDKVVLENALREELNRTAERRMAVLDPLNLVITNLPEGEAIELEAVNNPEDEAAGSRTLRLTREVWIERDDFRMEAPRKFHRLKPEGEVRLRYAFVVRCDEVITDDAGEPVELRCTYDPETGGGKAPEGRKVKGIVHWVSAADAVDADVVLYDHLFAIPDPEDVEDGQDYTANLNPTSRVERTGCKLEPSLGEAEPGATYQFERQGYFHADPLLSKPGAPAFHRTVALRDSWAKIEKRG